MNIIRKVAKNTGIIIAGEIINKIISLLIIIYLARYLGAIGYGKYSFVFAFISFFAIITDFGLNTIIARDTARDKGIAAKLITNAAAMKAVLSIIAIGSAIILINLMGYPEDTKAYVAILALTLVFNAFGGLYYAVFQANMKVEYGIVASLADRIISASLIIGIIFLNGTLLQIIAAVTFSRFISFFISYFYSRKFIKQIFEFDLTIWKYLLSESWPLILTGVFIMVNMRIDQVMLSKMTGDASVGYYSAAVNLVESLGIIPMAFMTSVFPLLAESFGRSREEHTKIYELSFKYLNMLVIPIAAGTTLLAAPIILFFYGNNFLPSVPGLQVLIWSEIFLFMGIVYSNLLVSTGAQKIIFVLTGVSAAVNILLNLLLIPMYGIIGAGIATVVAYALDSIIGLVLSSTRKYFISFWKSTIKPGIASIIMAFFIYYFSFSAEISVVFGAVVYFGILYIFKGFTKYDLEIFKQVLRKH